MWQFATYLAQFLHSREELWKANAALHCCCICCILHSRMLVPCLLLWWLLCILLLLLLCLTCLQEGCMLHQHPHCMQQQLE
jgi:hypothetical protein